MKQSVFNAINQLRQQLRIRDNLREIDDVRMSIVRDPSARVDVRQLWAPTAERHATPCEFAE